MKSRELLKKIGVNIKELRKEKGVKGETLARELGVTRAAISQLENGLVDCKISILSQIASALNTNLVDLIDGAQTLETQFTDYRFASEQHLRTINLLVCRIEYLNEKIEYLQTRKTSEYKSDFLEAI